MRLFISINLTRNIKNELADVQSIIQEAGMRGNYTTKTNMHLTLAFIGEYPDPDEVLKAMQNVNFRPFKIALHGVGTFGDIWWAGLEENVALLSVSRRLRKALDERNIPYDKKSFRPHITILRNSWPKRVLPLVELPNVGMTVKKISLMKSERGEKGMIYTEIGSVEALED